MYYYFCNGVIMKKIFLLWIICIISAPLGWAKSTCQTRVDKHSYSSTLERVDYCLNENDEQPDKGPQVLTYTVTTYTQQPADKNKKNSRRQSYFKRKKVSVSRSYVTTGRFPAWENKTEQTQPLPAAVSPAEKNVDYESDTLSGVFVSEPETVTRTEETRVQTVRQDPSSRVHGVVVSTTQTETQTVRSTQNDLSQPLRQTTTSRTVSSKTVSTTPPQQVMGKTISQTATDVQQTANRTWDDADELFEQSASQALGRADQAYNKAQETAAMQIQKADDFLNETDQALQNSYNRAEQNAQQALKNAQTKAEAASSRAKQQAERQIKKADEAISKPLNQADQAVQKAAADTQKAADRAWQDADELLNDWNY